ncbi:MAG: hypothetical protein ABJO36_14085 [Litorimonas sp.]
MTLDAVTFPDVIGLIGVLIILISYGALTLEKMDPKGWLYSAGNGLGAILILISLYYSFNLASFVIEIAWLAISLFGLWKAWRRG